MQVWFHLPLRSSHTIPDAILAAMYQARSRKRDQDDGYDHLVWSLQT